MSKTASRHGNSIYPWELWTNGEWHDALQGKQFKEARSVESFRRGLRVEAARRGMSVETHVKGKLVEFQFSPAKA